jgi:hypothetical protein
MNRIQLLFLLTYLLLIVFILYSGLKLVVKICILMLLLGIMFVAVNITTERYLKLRLGQEK